MPDAMTNSNSSNSSEQQQSPASQVKNFVAANRLGMLATTLHQKTQSKLPGYPFGSVVPYDVDPNGQVIILISRLAEHFKNIAADPRASLLVIDQYGLGDAQQFARATLVGEFTPVHKDDLDHITQSYWARFPEAPERSIAHDFEFFALAPKSIRWIGGFGDIRWINSAEYQNAAIDEITYHSHEILSHMNADHADAVQELLMHYGTRAKGQNAQMVAVSQEGFSIQSENKGKLSRQEIPFATPLSTVNDVRTVLIAMLKTARGN